MKPPPPHSPLSFSVVVPAHQAAGTLARCLEGIHSGMLSPVDEVLVVDDGSSDGTAAAAAGFPCTIVTHPEPRGAAAARNSGAARAAGSHLVFVDSDVVLPPGWRGTLAGLLTTTSPAQDIVVGFPAEQPPFADFFSAYKHLFIHHTYRRQAPGPLGGIYGSFFALERSLFHRLGGFDQRFVGAAFEDLELGLRAQAAGAKIFLTDLLCWQHLHRYSWRAALGNDVRRARGYVRTVLEGKGLLPMALRQGGANNADPRLVLGVMAATGAVFCAGWCLTPAAWLLPPGPLPALGVGAALLAAHLALNLDFLTLQARVGGGAMALKGLAWGVIDQAGMGMGMAAGLVDSLFKQVTSPSGRRYPKQVHPLCPIDGMEPDAAEATRRR